MWVFLSARLRQWLFLAVALPLLSVLVRGIRILIEKRTGQTRLTRLLGGIEDLGRRKKR